LLCFSWPLSTSIVRYYPLQIAAHNFRHIATCVDDKDLKSNRAVRQLRRW
jgi:hypothetical protein